MITNISSTESKLHLVGKWIHKHLQLWCHLCSHSILIITQCKLCSCFVISLGIHLLWMSKNCSIIISIFLCYVIFCASLDMNGTQGRLKSIRNTLFSKTRAYNKACNNIYLSESFFLSNHFSHSSNELEFYIGCRKE